MTTLLCELAKVDELDQFASPILKSDRYIPVGLKTTSTVQSAPTTWVPQARTYSRQWSNAIFPSLPTNYNLLYPTKSHIRYLATRKLCISPSCVCTSVGEVWFGLVWAIFSQTRNQAVWFQPKFLKLKLKLIETIYIGLVQFKLSLRQFHVATPAQIGLMLTQPLLPLHSTIKQVFLKESLVKYRTKTTYTQSLALPASFYSTQFPPFPLFIVAWMLGSII